MSDIIFSLNYILKGIRPTHGEITKNLLRNIVDVTKNNILIKDNRSVD